MEEFVSREEFESLKREVEDIKLELSKSTDILQKIERKIDVIFERFENSNKLNEIQSKNLDTVINSKIDTFKKDIENNKEDIKDIQDNNKWLWRTVGATIIGIVIKVLFDIV